MIYLPLALMYEPSLDQLLSGTERRYNGAVSLQMRFEQHFRGGGQPSRTESGLLFLKKPGRMRWEYRNPEGKLFVSDGRYVWFYSPAMNQVEKSALKMSEDVRAPLAFLMGQLNFRRDFAILRAAVEGQETHVWSTPKSARSPYREVEFWISAGYELRQVRVASQEGGTMEFRFREERLGGAVNEGLFRFVAPAGAEVVER
ncbi:MAG: outer membrane lipoprotein chaperone LolA [Bryobacteraceae bacterium]|nr:outer membrane lipoprotein chaperone LolA [Bryobacteraceae bacterium]